jgi:hypothetical protein
MIIIEGSKVYFSCSPEKLSMYFIQQKKKTYQTLLPENLFSLAPHSFSHFKSLSSSGVRSISALGAIYEQF